MDPEKRLTCSQLTQHPYFDGFSNEFDRERKEQQKHLHREQQKLLQAKMQNSVYATGPKQPNPGVRIDLNLIETHLSSSIFHLSLGIKITTEIIHQRPMNVLDAIFIYPISVRESRVSLFAIRF